MPHIYTQSPTYTGKQACTQPPWDLGHTCTRAPCRAPVLCATVPPLPALLSAVRINGDGQEVLYLAEGDNVRLGCPYILDPEDYGPNGLDIEWMQLNSDPAHRENVVSVAVGCGVNAPLPARLCGSASVSPAVSELPGQADQPRQPAAPAAEGPLCCLGPQPVRRLHQPHEPAGVRHGHLRVPGEEDHHGLQEGHRHCAR